MSELLQAEALLRGLILFVPLLVLLVLAGVWVTRRQTERQRGPVLPDDMPGEAHLSTQEPATTMTLMERHNPPKAEACGEIAAVERQIAGAEASGAHDTMAAMYLVLAAHKRALGLDKEAQSALRSAAGIGAQHGPGYVHAAARIALAQAAVDQGDLTAACEQWQLARNAFQRDGKAADADEIDKRMRANGCPTDWVLTDF